ncbi:MAG: hypothetical protein ABIL40_08315, partial [candidate division WOR-3 bacterium]
LSKYPWLFVSKSYAQPKIKSEEYSAPPLIDNSAKLDIIIYFTRRLNEKIAQHFGAFPADRL